MQADFLMIRLYAVVNPLPTRRCDLTICVDFSKQSAFFFGSSLLLKDTSSSFLAAACWSHFGITLSRSLSLISVVRHMRGRAHRLKARCWLLHVVLLRSGLLSAVLSYRFCCALYHALF